MNTQVHRSSNVTARMLAGLKSLSRSRSRPLNISRKTNITWQIWATNGTILYFVPCLTPLEGLRTSACQMILQTMRSHADSSGDRNVKACFMMPTPRATANVNRSAKKVPQSSCTTDAGHASRIEASPDTCQIDKTRRPPHTRAATFQGAVHIKCEQ